jgi:hypothetical protein
MSATGEPMVMVVTAWHDDGRVRARVVHEATGLRRTVTCKSVNDLIDTIRALLEAWDDSGRGQEPWLGVSAREPTSPVSALARTRGGRGPVIPRR